MLAFNFHDLFCFMACWLFSSAGAELAYQIYDPGWIILDMQNKANPSAAVVRTGAGTRYMTFDV